jgi:hypothetical protein
MGRNHSDRNTGRLAKREAVTSHPLKPCCARCSAHVSCLVSRLSCLVSRLSSLVSRVSCLVSRVSLRACCAETSCMVFLKTKIQQFFDIRKGLSEYNGNANDHARQSQETCLHFLARVQTHVQVRRSKEDEYKERMESEIARLSEAIRTQDVVRAHVKEVEVKIARYTGMFGMQASSECVCAQCASIPHSETRRSCACFPHLSAWHHPPKSDLF